MLFSGKENVFMCLAVTKFVLRKINFGVWFIQTFLQKMHQIRQKKQNAAKENESNPTEEKMRSRGEGDSERRRGRRSSDERRGRCDRPTSGAIDECVRATRRSTSGARPTSALVDRRAARSSDECARRSHRSIDDRAARLRGEARSSLSLSDLGSFFSLLSSLSDRRTSILSDLMHFLVKRLNEPNTKINFP